VYKSTN